MTQDTTNHDTLIGRIIDGEASRDDLKQFEAAARDDSGLWQKLALRQIDMSRLSDQVLDTTAVAEVVEAKPRVSGGTGRFVVALSGWAAVILLVAVWWVFVGPARLGSANGAGLVEGVQPAELSYDQHLKKYMEAPYVSGEMDLVMFESTKLPDGRHRIHFVRRIEEHVDVSVSPRSLVDARGKMTVDPSKLRSSAERRKRRSE